MRLFPFFAITSPLCPLLVFLADQFRGLEAKGVLSNPLPGYKGSGESPGCLTEFFRYPLGSDFSPKPGEGA